MLQYKVILYKKNCLFLLSHHFNPGFLSYFLFRIRNFFDHGSICLLFALVAPQVSNLNYKVNKSELAWFQTQVSNEQ